MPATSRRARRPSRIRGAPTRRSPATRWARRPACKRIGVNLARIAPGKEAFPYHAHWQEEEWIYILEGRGLARIDGAEYEVAAGDFMAFPTPGVAHSLRNPFERELVYLMGGESRELDVADFPDLGRRMFRHAKGVEVFELGAGKPIEAVSG